MSQRPNVDDPRIVALSIVTRPAESGALPHGFTDEPGPVPIEVGMHYATLMFISQEARRFHTWISNDHETTVEGMKDTDLIALLDRHRADIKLDLGSRIDTVSDQVGTLRTETADRLDRVADEVGQLRTDLTTRLDTLTTTVTDFRVESSERITRLEAQFATTISLSKWGIGILAMILIAIIGAAVSGN